MKVVIEVEHVATGKIWRGTECELTAEELSGTEDFLQEVAKRGKYFNLENEGGWVIIPEDIIKQSVLKLVKV